MIRRLFSGSRPGLAAVALLAVSAPIWPAAAVTLDFDDLATGEVVDDDYVWATFSSPGGEIWAISVPFAPSAPHVICTVPADGGPTCVSEIQVVFTSPVGGLILTAVGAKNAGVVARVEVVSGGMVVGFEDVVSPGGDGTTPIEIDLTAYMSVGEIRIFDVGDPAGLAFDDLSFIPDQVPLFFDGFESGDTSVWSMGSSPPTALATVNFPVSIAGDYAAAEAEFGLPLDITGQTGNLEYVDDGNDQGGVGSIHDGCDPLIGFTPGNFALIDAGPCEFSLQVLNAQNAGALAAVVVSTTGDNLVIMPPGTFGGAVMISSVFIGLSDGELIKTELGQTINVTLQPILAPLVEERP